MGKLCSLQSEGEDAPGSLFVGENNLACQVFLHNKEQTEPELNHKSIKGQSASLALKPY